LSTLVDNYSASLTSQARVIVQGLKKWGCDLKRTDQV
jgi:hypothetical protein